MSDVNLDKKEQSFWIENNSIGLSQFFFWPTQEERYSLRNSDLSDCMVGKISAGYTCGCSDLNEAQEMIQEFLGNSSALEKTPALAERILDVKKVFLENLEIVTTPLYRMTFKERFGLFFQSSGHTKCNPLMMLVMTCRAYDLAQGACKLQPLHRRRSFFQKKFGLDLGMREIPHGYPAISSPDGTTRAASAFEIYISPLDRRDVRTVHGPSQGKPILQIILHTSVVPFRVAEAIGQAVHEASAGLGRVPLNKKQAVQQPCYEPT
ncbi:MAG: hypothetical protein IPI58_06085 [Alphaproteobacteria bacterium]|nr:MAG: hypothetical protein IPI58_06085 [Alphaproteobacteria bacterium]